MLYKYSLASLRERDAVHLFGRPVLSVRSESGLKLPKDGGTEPFVDGSETGFTSDALRLVSLPLRDAGSMGSIRAGWCFL